MSFLSYLAVGLSPGGLVRAPSRKILKRTALGLAVVAGLAVAANVGHDYWKNGRFLQSTTNAYVRADYTIVSPKISGHIIEVLVQDNEAVTAGHVVARVDDRDFKVALAQAQADVASEDAELSNLDARIAQQQSAIDQEIAGIASVEASLSYAQADHVRYGNLKKSGYGTVQRAEKAETAMRQKTAQLLQSRAGLLMAQRKHRHSRLGARQGAGPARAQPGGPPPGRAQSLLHADRRARSRALVGARSLRVGQYVQAGTQLMAVVPLDAVYIVANFKETQLTHVRAGQPVEIEVDGFPGVVAQGPCRQRVAGERARVRAAAARQRHRQLHQDRAARSGEDRARRQRARRPPAPRHVGRADRRHAAGRGDRRALADERPSSRTDTYRDAVALKTWIAVVGSTLGAFMAVLNIQIVNASLGDIQGAIGAGIDDGGWISTAYLVAEIVVIPLTGWLVAGLLGAPLPDHERGAVPGRSPSPAPSRAISSQMIVAARPAGLHAAAC